MRGAAFVNFVIFVAKIFVIFVAKIFVIFVAKVLVSFVASSSLIGSAIDVTNHQAGWPAQSAEQPS